MTDVWVVDASPLIILGQVGKLDWLEQLSSRLVVPDAVADEVLSGPEDPAHRALLSGWGEWQRASVPESVGLDRIAGDLVEYTNPRELALGSGKSTRYTYYTGSGQENLDHNLRCVILPEGGRDPGDVEPLCGPAGQGHTWTHFVYYANDIVYEQTSSLGEVSHLYYDFFRRRTEVVFPDGAKEAYIFDRVGNIIRMETGRGVVHSYEYEDGTRNRTHELDGFGRATTATYDGLGNVTSRTDRLEKSELWTYNARSQPTSHVDRNGHRREWRYDARGNLLEELAVVDSRLELLARHRYDGFGNRIETTTFTEAASQGERTTVMRYDGQGVALTGLRDAAGHWTQATNDALGRPVRIETTRTVAGAAQPEAIVTTTSYDALGRVVASVAPGGAVTEMDYDANGNAVEMRAIAPAPGESPATACAAAESPRCVRERMLYGAGERAIAMVDPLGNETRAEYDTRGRLVRTLSPLGAETQMEYDLGGNLVRAIDAAGAETSFVYDGEDRLACTTNALGQVTRLVRDGEGRVVERWFPLSQCDFASAPAGRRTERIELDAEGMPIRMWDAEDREVALDLDELGRVRSATALPGTQHAATTAFAYDLAGRPLARTDALGKTWRFRYDRLGRLEETTDPLGRQRTMGYDEVGNLVSQVDGAGVELTFAYDVRGLLTRRTGPDVDDTFGYDGFGREVLAKNALRTLSFEHDRLGRVVAVQDPDFLGTLRRSFDADGRMTQVLYPTSPEFGFPQGVATRFEYDPRGQLTGVRDPSGRWDHRYDALGRLLETRGPGGVAQRRSYTTQGFLSRVDTTLAGGGSEAIAYSQYDATGLPGRIDTSEGTTQLGYHARGWLTSVSYPDGTSELFGYDRVGNRTTQTPRTGPPRFYGYDIADQLRLVIDADRFDTFDYDGAGRRITKTPGTDTAAQTRYAYDGLGRLTHVEDPGTSCSPDLRYDALGRRVVRHEVCSFPSFPNIHQLKESVYPSDWAERRDDVGRVRLVRGGGPDGVLAEINATVPGTRSAALLDDGLANLAHADPLAGTPGTPGTRRYEAFGTVRSETGATTAVERGFAGLVPEGNTGLLYARARHYEPETGRFLQPEPMGLFQPNLYSYASNNPVVFSDPSGLAPQLNLSGAPDFLDFGSGDPFFGGGGSSGGSLGQTVAGVATGLLAGAGVGAGLGAAGTAAAAFCPVCAAVIGIGGGLASVKLEVDSGFAGIRGFVEAAKAVASGDATFGQAFSAGFLPGSLAGGFLGARAASSFLPAVDVGAEVAASFTGAARGGVGPVLKGQAGVERAVARAQARGETVLGREITIETAAGRTRPDLLTRTPEGNLRFIECKNGPCAALNTRQRRAFPLIESQGGIPRGGNAAAVGLEPGVPIGPTEVLIERFP